MARFGLWVVCVVSRGCGTCYPSQVYVTTRQLGHSHGLFSEDKVVQIPSGPDFGPYCPGTLNSETAEMGVPKYLGRVASLG